MEDSFTEDICDGDFRGVNTVAWIVGPIVEYTYVWMGDNDRFIRSVKEGICEGFAKV